jgi:hypothetical protein
MLERVLDALMFALEPPAADPRIAARQKDAQAALRSLGQAGMLQHIDPEDLFDPDGAWPSLLPTLIQDQRWEHLFAHLHGLVALQPYRQQARAWVEWAQRRSVRLMQENRVIANQLLAAQRRNPRGSGSQGTPGIPFTPPHVPPTAYASGTGQAETLLLGTYASEAGVAETTMHVPEGHAATQEPVVPTTSLMSPQGLGVIEGRVGTSIAEARHQAVPAQTQVVSGESLRRDQITMPCWSHEQSIHTTDETEPAQNTLEQPSGDIPLVAPHIRDEELSSTRHDSHFWQAIQQILHGDQQRYAYTEGEKKAAYRLFKRTNTPVGVVLAALRAVMSLPESRRPRTFGEALKLSVFHECVQQALALTQAQTADPASVTWAQFLQAYRSIGQTNSLRDVSVPEYHVLKALFERQPDACWEVLQRAEQAAQPPQLSVAYLRRAISNNQQAAALRTLQPAESSTACRRAGGKTSPRRVPEAVPEALPTFDARRVLLEREGVNPAILTASMTEEHIQAWIVEADARRTQIKDRPAWLAWGIRSGYLPREHPKLPPTSQQSEDSPPGFCPCGRYTSGGICAHCALTTPDLEGAVTTPGPQISLFSGQAHHVAREAMSDPGGTGTVPQRHQVWQVALNNLRKYLPYTEFETWIKETALVQVENQQAIVGAPNIFVRDKLAEVYVPLIADTLQTILGFPVQVAIVLDSQLVYGR